MQTPNETLEKLFYPSKWSPRLPPEVIVQKHIEFSQKESEKTRQTISSTLNLSYGPLEREKIDIFGTDLDNDAPIFVFLHGGFWQAEAVKRDIYHFLATPLHKNGIKSIFVGYERCPIVSLSKIVTEIEVAIKKCIDYARTHKSKGLYVAGLSAGSHLLATLYTNIAKSFTNEDRNFIKAAILMAGLYDLEQIPHTSINIALKLSKTEAIELSPYQQNIISDVSTTFYIVDGENDSPEFKKQTEEFNKKLKEAGVNSTALVVPKVDHFNIVEMLYHEDFELTKLILNLISKHDTAL